jgi:hypothetical protein
VLPLPKPILALTKRPTQTLFAAICLVLSVSTLLQAQQRDLSEAEAVQFAEQFITQNGYTDQQPDKTKLAYERIEWESNLDEMLKQRHDTLERRAYGVRRERKNGFPGWTVVFRYKHPTNRRERRIGRAVTLNLDGSDARVEHVDFILRNVERK